jgi:hypothetical protein
LLVQVPAHWLESVYTYNVAHARAAERSRMWGRGLGLLALAFTTITGTTLFTTLAESPSQSARTVMGALAAVSALLVAFNTFFAFAEQEVAHRKAATKYGALKHELEEFAGKTTQARLDSLRERWDKLSGDSPTLPRHGWKSANKYVKERLASD